MLGDGTKPAATTNRPAARLLDLTRSMRRVGGIATGIDRVEHTYLKRLLAEDLPLFGIVRSPFGYLLLDRAGLGEVAQRLSDDVPWGRPDFLSKIPRKHSPIRRAAEADFRAFSIARTTPRRLRKMLRRQFPNGFSYLNVGHSNLTPRVLSAVRSVSNARVSVMVHDVIPLDFPQYQRIGTPEAFERKMRQVVDHADHVICNSAATEERFVSWAKRWGRVPKTHVAHLGVEIADPDAITLPKQPYFITVGTIEPRKNHALLLDIWESLGAEAPPLLICGKRGWRNKAVFNRLDSLRNDDRVQEISDASDQEIAALVKGACAALYPSHAEGFCLPAVEAVGLGTPVLCSSLPVFHEIIGKYATFAEIEDQQAWKNNIIRLASDIFDQTKLDDFVPPDWEKHFEVVLSFA